VGRSVEHAGGKSLRVDMHPGVKTQLYRWAEVGTVRIWTGDQAAPPLLDRMSCGRASSPHLESAARDGVVHAGTTFAVLGSVFLALTGGEALYADMGHFGRSAIRISWFAFVLPALVLVSLTWPA
jgi:hypothetical protein